MAGRKRRRISLGTSVMLVLTALVLLGCVLFLWLLVGDNLYERTEMFIRTLSEEGLFDGSSGFELAALSTARDLQWIPPEDTPLPATAPPPTPTPVPKPVTITISAAGTVYAPKAVRESVQEGSRFDFEPVFAGLGDTLADADLAIATLETTTAGKDRGFDNYNTAPEILDALRSAGVDLVALGTERALDKGYEGLDLTVSELTTRGLAFSGVSTDGGVPERAAMLSVGGVQVAVISASYGLSSEGEEKTKGDSRGVLARLDMQRLEQEITEARVRGANVVIVLPHWGTKNKQDTPVNVRRQAMQMAEAGADIILGTHPNVAQGTERLRVTRRDGLEYETAVCYSLGSLLTDARTKENTAGMIAHVDVTYDPVTRRTTLSGMYCTPVYIARERIENAAVYRVVDPENTQAMETLSQAERQAAMEAAELIRSITQTQEGHG